MGFRDATKRKAKLRHGLVGPSGSGKTYTALEIAKCLGGLVVACDTERGSMEKYADIFQFKVWDDLPDFDPARLIHIIGEAEKAGANVFIVDSLSHFWSGKGGMLERVDEVTARSRSKNAFSEGWRTMSPVHNQLIDTLVGCQMHVIAGMRSKVDWVIEENEHGKKVPRKIGLAPVQREGMEYEFDIVGDIDWDHRMVISKSRCSALDGKSFVKPGQSYAEIVKKWLEEGVDGPAPEPAPAAKPPAAKAAAKKPVEQPPMRDEVINIDKILDAFAGIGLVQAQVEQMIEKPANDWMVGDKPRLQALFSRERVKYRAAKADMEGANL